MREREITVKQKAIFVIAILATAASLGISTRLRAMPAASPVVSAAALESAATAGQHKVIQIVAHKFTFDPNQITLKKGEKVTLQLTSRDVTHGFYIRGMKIDEEIEPGKTTEITITPDKAGTFPTICDHLCGLGHKNMAMTIVVEE